MQNTDLVYTRVKKTLQRHKNIEYPKIPRTILEIRDEFKKPVILNKYGFNFGNDAKFYVGTVVSPNHGFSVFASEFVIKFIQNNIPPASREYIMDGTFDKISKQFYQMLTITIAYQNDVS